MQQRFQTTRLIMMEPLSPPDIDLYPSASWSGYYLIVQQDLELHHWTFCYFGDLTWRKNSPVFCQGSGKNPLYFWRMLSRCFIKSESPTLLPPIKVSLAAIRRLFWGPCPYLGYIVTLLHQLRPQTNDYTVEWRTRMTEAAEQIPD